MPTTAGPTSIPWRSVSIITLSVTSLAVAPALLARAADVGPRPAATRVMETSAIVGAPAAPAAAGGPVDTAAFLRRVAQPARTSYRSYKVPASVTIAQAILESGWGRSRLAVNDKNYFGIKCSGSRYGTIAIGCHAYPTSEWDGRRYKKVTASFRVYKSITGSFRDHGAFLRYNSRYGPAFRYSRAPERFAQAIAAAGYATSPTYAASLIRLMRQYNLYQYDR